MNLKELQGDQIDNKPRALLIIIILAIPFIVYFYFFNFQTQTLYGDDLFLLRTYSGLHGFSERINLPVVFGKFRPVQGLLVNLVIETFQKNIHAYFLFNVLIQVINVYLFALVANLLIKSPYLSLLSGILIGLSKFSYFNIAQLLNGGVLEGMAMTMMLASLYFLMRVYVRTGLTMSQKKWCIFWSIMFANLAMNTHERYIVLLPFISVVIFLFSTLKALSLKYKIGFSLLAMLCVVANVAIKKSLFSLPFFVGTANTNIEFSLLSALKFLGEGILAFFQISTGPEHLVGFPFQEMKLKTQLVVLLLAVLMLFILIRYLIGARKILKEQNLEKKRKFFAFLLLFFLNGLFLIPTIVTIRLEPRWLQASFALFLLMMMIALDSIPFRKMRSRVILLSSLVLFYFLVDATYLYKGWPKLYFAQAETLAVKFKNGIKNGEIKRESNKLYIWESKRDPAYEETLLWTLGKGFFFDFYLGKNEEILFADSTYQPGRTISVGTVESFDSSTMQILHINREGIEDITKEYLLDSLKGFDPDRIKPHTIGKTVYNQDSLLVSIDDLDNFISTGFHEKEGNGRWTNGNASLEFLGDFTAKDSLEIELDTYMPPICKDIVPKLIITDVTGIDHLPVITGRQGDQFKYVYRFDEPTNLKKISLKAGIIDSKPDLRVLSFPFLGLKIKNWQISKRKK